MAALCIQGNEGDLAEEERQITIGELYELVWQRPMVHLAREFGVSNTALSRCCKRHGIPTPPAGYWTKVEMGICVRIPKLKLDQKELQHFVSLPVSSPLEDHAKQTKRDRFELKKLLPPPHVVSELVNLHPIVEKWLSEEEFEIGSSCEPVKYKRIGRQLSEYDDFRLRVTSAFLRSVEAGGASITRADLNGRIELEIDEAKLVVIVRQKMSEVPRKGIELENWTAWPEHHGYWLFPTKNLKFSLKGEGIRPVEFSCSQKQVLEFGLQRIVVCVLSTKTALSRIKAERIKAHLAAKKADEILRHKKRILETDCLRWERFKEIAEKWEETQKLRSFVQRLREISEERKLPQVDRVAFEQWLRWAEEKVAENDPTTDLGRLFKTDA